MANLRGGSTVAEYLIWHAGNMGAGSGLDADTIQGIPLLGLVQQSQLTGYTLPATAGWYRIAISPVDIGRNIARFELAWTKAGGANGQVTFNASVTYGAYSSVNQIQFSGSGTAGVTQARIVYHTTYTGNYAYLEIYIADANAYTIDLQMISALGWSLMTPAAGSIPSGYSTETLAFTNGIATTEQLVSTVGTGVAPLVVTSTTKVTNLNADMVDGYHLNQDVQTTASPTHVKLTLTQAAGTAPMTITSTTVVANLNADLLDGQHSATAGTANTIVSRDANGNITGNRLVSTVASGTSPLTVTSTTVVGNLNADMVDSYHAGNASGNIPISNGTSNTNLNADMVDGYHVGNATGQVPLSNGTTNVNLDADTLDGYHAYNFARLSAHSTSYSADLYANQWTKLASVRITTQYHDGIIVFEIAGTGDGNTMPTFARLHFRVKQQNAMASAPYVNLFISESYMFTSANFTAVVVTNTATETVVELYAKVPMGYQTIVFNPIVSIGSGEKSFYSTQAYSASLPAGTQIACSGLGFNYDIAGSGNISGSTLTSTVATGTAPLTVASTTAVTNLNADMVDGYHLNQDVQTTASPSFVKLTSTQATGTAPFTVTSTTKVTNLNADSVDGYHLNQDVQTTASPGFVKLTLSQATGTAPMTVTSTTAVTNLNSDLLDGQHGSYYLAWANLTGVPTTISGYGISDAYTKTDVNTVRNETFDNFTYTGCAVTASATALTVSIAAGTVYVAGVRYIITSTTKLLTASTTAYIYVSNTGTVTASTTAPTGDYAYLAKVTVPASGVIPAGNIVDTRNIVTTAYGCYSYNVYTDTGIYAQTIESRGPGGGLTIKNSGSGYMLRLYNTDDSTERVVVSGSVVKLFSGEDFGVYSDAGTTSKFYVTGSSGNTTIAGTLAVTGAVTLSSTVSATRITSTQATGTSPFNVTSTTVNTNLNADMVDGYHAATANTASTVVARDASGNFSAGTITAALTGNASTATKLATTRMLEYTGDLEGGDYFDGSSNLMITLTLLPTGVTAGTYTKVTVDDKGRVNGASNPTTLAGYGITDAASNVNTTLTGLATVTAGGNTLSLKAGATSDHVFMSFYADSQAQATRSGYFGYGSAGTVDMYIANEMTNGSLLLTTNGTGAVKVNGYTVITTNNIGSYGAATAGNISNTGTVTLASATESNAITVTAPAFGASGLPVKLLNFNWYSDPWSLGAVRGSSNTTLGLGVFRGGTEIFRFSSSGTFDIKAATPFSSGITGSTYGAINLPDTTIGAGNFATGFHMATIVSGVGYRQHLSIGNYRTGAQYNGGMFVGLGGSDSNPTEYFLMNFGGEITHSSGKTFWNSGNSPKSLAENGYQNFANGMIIQWGYSNVTVGNGVGVLSFNFPVAFPSRCCVITGSVVDSSGISLPNANVAFYSPSTSGANFWVGNNTMENGNVNVKWIAIGY